MCADLLRLEDEIRQLELNRADYIHVDIMDGIFVPNYTLGTDFIKLLHKTTNIPLDIHLMVERPDEKIKYFELRSGDIVSIHCEAAGHLQRALSTIKDMGARCAAALNPSTPLCSLDYIIDDIDMVLIMTVNPGYAGQKLIPATLKKISCAKRMIKEAGREDVLIEVDGNVSFENAVRMAKAGADVFVGGTSSIYDKRFNMHENFARLARCVNGV